MGDSFLVLGVKQQATAKPSPRQARARQLRAQPVQRVPSARPSSPNLQPRKQVKRPGKRVGGLAIALRMLYRGVTAVTRLRLAGKPVWAVSITATLVSFLAGQALGMVFAVTSSQSPNLTAQSIAFGNGGGSGSAILANSRPQLSPLPTNPETWNCDVVVIGGSLGGVAAASQAMRSGSTTCLIELTPWLGGQISSQGVSALDESQALQAEETLSKSWNDFKAVLKEQSVQLPPWTNRPTPQKVESTNSCWVGLLCFPPQAGATASEQLLKTASAKAPDSHWSTATAFKGAEFDATGRQITTVYAVRRTPRDPNYRPKGRFSAELASWYSWSRNDEFEKTPLKLQAKPGKRLIVIDATDTGELIGWAGIPHRLGSESLATTGERNASRQDNSDCTQAFTYPFVLAIHDDKGASLKALTQLESDYSKEEHRSDFDLQNFPVFSGRSFFNYRRIVSMAPGDPYQSTPVLGDMSLINWNRGNDWKFMDPPLILTSDQIEQSGQRKNWLGGISVPALRHAENHAFLFAHWLLENHAKQLPLTYLYGAESPLGTQSGLSMVPYIREGRRIVGRKAYDQREFAIREADLRVDMSGTRDFSQTAIARIHYSIDIHGCVYRNGNADGEAASAGVFETHVRPTLIPLEALIPQGVDNLLMGGKSIAVTHIANGMTRIHQSEWGIGSAAGATAGWLITNAPTLSPIDIVTNRQIPKLREHLNAKGLGLDPNVLSSYSEAHQPKTRPSASTKSQNSNSAEEN
jgi:FAD dependent oxidoreductase